jgi:hypothetical protein
MSQQNVNELQQAVARVLGTGNHAGAAADADARSNPLEDLQVCGLCRLALDRSPPLTMSMCDDDDDDVCTQVVGAFATDGSTSRGLCTVSLESLMKLLAADGTCVHVRAYE